MENYSKMFHAEPVEETIVEPITELEEIPVEKPINDTLATFEPEIPEEPDVVEPTIGVVVNCTKLNVREQPNADAEVVCTVAALDEVEIEEEESTKEFYKICTVTGLEGYCMKKFIVIRE